MDSSFAKESIRVLNYFVWDATIALMEEKPRTTPYPLRMPDELRAQLEDAAKNGSRSLHAEIVARLQESFDAPPARSGLPPGTIEELERLFEEKLGGRVYIDRADGGRTARLVADKKRTT